jgi:hypothetical protein
MSHRFKAPKKIGAHVTERMDPIEVMLRKIARKITSDEQLHDAAMKIPPYARDNFLRELRPYLTFTPGRFIEPQPVNAETIGQGE